MFIFAVEVTKEERECIRLVLGSLCDSERDKGLEEGWKAELAAAVDTVDEHDDGMITLNLEPAKFQLIGEQLEYFIDYTDEELADYDIDPNAFRAVWSRFNPEESVTIKVDRRRWPGVAHARGLPL